MTEAKRERAAAALIAEATKPMPMWRCQDHKQAAYVEEIRRRQPSAFLN